MKIFIFIVALALSGGIPMWFFNTYRENQENCLRAAQKTTDLTAKKTALEEKIKQISNSTDDNTSLITEAKKQAELKTRIATLKTENEALENDMKKIRQNLNRLQQEQADINALYNAVKNRSARKKSIQ